MAKRKIAYNKSEYPNSFKRQGAFPLDETSVKYSKEDLDTYAKSNDAGAYVGQIVTVVPSTKPSNEDVAVEAETYVIYSEGGKVNRLVKESELLALDATSSVDKTEDNLQYISTISQKNGQITASHKTLVAGDNISIKAAKDTGDTTIANTAAYLHSSTSADASTSNLEYITEVTQSKGQISAKKKTLSGTANNISVTTDANGNTTIKDIAKYEHSSTKVDTTANNLEYLVEVTQADGTIAAKKKTLQGTASNISITTDTTGKTTVKDIASYDDSSASTDDTSDATYISKVSQTDGTIATKKKTLKGTDKNISVTVNTNGDTVIKDIANVTDDDYADTNSEYVAKVTQTNGTIAYEKHTIEGGDNISVSTSGGKTTVSNTARCTDTAQDNKYISAVTQQNGAITEIGRRKILEPTESETSKTISNGAVVVITSAEPPTGDDGIILKNRKIKGDKGIEVIVGNSNSDITVQHATTVKGSDGNVDGDGKASTSQTSDKTAITNGGTFTISDVNYDAQGHVTSENTATLTVPKYSGGTGISITLDNGKTNEYTITNSASVNSTTNNTTNSKDYIVSVSGSNGSVTPTKKVLTAGTGITITTGTGNTDADKTKLTIGHTNNLTFTGTATTDTAQTSTASEVTDGKFTVPKVTYDKQGHITSKGTTEITIAKATANKLGLVRTNYSNNGANIKLDVESDGDAYSTLTSTAIKTALNGDLILQPTSGTDEGGQIQLLPSTTDSFKNNTGVIIDTAHGDLRVFGQGGANAGNLLLINPYNATVGGASNNATTYTFNGSFALPSSIKNKYTGNTVGGISANTQITDTSVEDLLKRILGIKDGVAPSGFRFSLSPSSATLNLNADSQEVSATWSVDKGTYTGNFTPTIGGISGSATSSTSGTISGISITGISAATTSKSVSGSLSHEAGTGFSANTLNSNSSLTINRNCYYGASSGSLTTVACTSRTSLSYNGSAANKPTFQYPQVWGECTIYDANDYDVTKLFTKTVIDKHGGKYYQYTLTTAVNDTVKYTIS